MKKIKIATILAALLLMLSCCLSSCKNKNENNDDSEDHSIESNEQENSDVACESKLISDKGAVKFSIVYQENIPEDIAEAVTNLHNAITKRSGGGTVNIGIADIDSYSADSYEILIGDIGYPESKKVMDDIGYGEWTVRFEENKLVVAGFSRTGLNSAISELIKNIKKVATDDGTIAFEGDMNITKTEHEVLNKLPRFENIGYPQTADEGNDTGLAVLSNADANVYSAYLSKITSEGYKLYTSNDIKENKFSTYDNGEYVIHTGYSAYESSIRVTIEKKTHLAGLEFENTFVKNDEVVTSLAQIGLGEDKQEGMSYCYQLADGSFFVIDGGFTDDSEQLYEYMRAKAPGEKIIIAAWLLTHNDADHRGAFIDFNGKYKNDVIIERFIHNLPAALTYEESGGNGDTTALGIANELSGCKIIKAHTGQRIYIRNAVVEMLYTLDSYLPRKLTIFNNSSLVFTVDVEGERALFMGDGSDEVAQILYSMYGDYLKSDILQLAHHGLRNGHGTNMPHTVKLYGFIRPEIVLWPSSNAKYLNKNQAKDQQVDLFKWNIEGLKSARECFMAGDGITVLELPYSLYSAYKFVSGETRVPVCKDTQSTTDSLQYDEYGIDERVSWSD